MVILKYIDKFILIFGILFLPLKQQSFASSALTETEIKHIKQMSEDFEAFGENNWSLIKMHYWNSRDSLEQPLFNSIVVRYQELILKYFLDSTTGLFNNKLKDDYICYPILDKIGLRNDDIPHPDIREFHKHCKKICQKSKELKQLRDTALCLGISSSTPIDIPKQKLYPSVLEQENTPLWIMDRYKSSKEENSPPQ